MERKVANCKIEMLLNIFEKKINLNFGTLSLNRFQYISSHKQRFKKPWYPRLFLILFFFEGGGGVTEKETNLTITSTPYHYSEYNVYNC